MRVPAPAKINLHLRVGTPRTDGFHPLLSWMCTAELFDTLTLVRGPSRAPAGERPPAQLSPAQLSPAQSSPAQSSPDEPQRESSRHESWFTLATDHPDLPTDGRNLVVKVATRLADTLGQPGPNRLGEGSIDVRRERVSAFLNKRIPAGAGLGGGSADAAAALLALARLWKLDWSTDRLSAFAATIGSDVPFFLHGPSSVCTGRGEIVRPTPPPAIARHAVLVLPGVAMPTPAVYAKFDALGLGSDAALRDEPDWQTWATLPARQLLPEFVNDLEPAAFARRPELDELRKDLERHWQRPVRMSGSGSSLFTLCDDAGEAETFAAQARAQQRVDAMAVRLAPPLNMYPAAVATTGGPAR